MTNWSATGTMMGHQAIFHNKLTYLFASTSSELILLFDSVTQYDKKGNLIIKYQWTSWTYLLQPGP